MALPNNNKSIGDLGHTEDHNAIVNEISFMQENYISASSTILTDNYLRKDTASSTYATIVSPSFSGTPVAPTAISGTDTDQIATTAFVKTEIHNLVASAPGALDTLNELAAALGDDANFAATITNSIASKLDSGTASSIYLTQDNASTIYFPISASSNLLTESEASELYLPVSASSEYLRLDTASAIYSEKLISTNAQTASSYTLVLSDSNKLIEMNTASGNIILIPVNASVAFPIGTQINIIQTGAGETSITPISGVTLNSDTNKRKINSQWAAASLIKRDTDTWLLMGALKP